MFRDLRKNVSRLSGNQVKLHHSGRQYFPAATGASMPQYAASRVFQALFVGALLTAPRILTGQPVALSSGTIITPTFRSPWPPPRFQSATSGSESINAAG